MCINYDNFEKSRFFHLEDPPSPIYNAEVDSEAKSGHKNLYPAL